MGRGLRRSELHPFQRMLSVGPVCDLNTTIDSTYFRVVLLRAEEKLLVSSWRDPPLYY